MDKKKEYKDMRETMKAMLDIKENLYPEMEPIVDWLDLFTEKMKKACADAMSQFPEGQKDPGEALMIGLARFNCYVLEKFQSEGFVTEGHNAYDIFYEVLMPTAHEMVKREMQEHESDEDDGTAQQLTDLAEDLMNPDVPIDDIIAKHFRDDMTDEERQLVRKKLENLRQMHMGNNKGN